VFEDLSAAVAEADELKLDTSAVRKVILSLSLSLSLSVIGC